MIPTPMLVLIIVGIVCSLTSLSLLISSQAVQHWIYYVTATSGSITTPIATTYVTTINAEIGLWDTYYTAATDFANAFVTDQFQAATIDTSTSGYFNEDSVKACQALAILATISIFAAIVCAHVCMFLDGSPRKTVIIATISTAGFTTFLATVAMIVVRTQFKDGMSIDKSFKMCIAADVIVAAATACFVAALILSSDSNKTKPTDDKTEMKQTTSSSYPGQEKKTPIPP